MVKVLMHGPSFFVCALVTSMLLHIKSPQHFSVVPCGLLLRWKQVQMLENIAFVHTWYVMSAVLNDKCITA